MKKTRIILIIALTAGSFCFKTDNKQGYRQLYISLLSGFSDQQQILLGKIKNSNLRGPQEISEIKNEIELARLKLKSIDFWLRYFEPVAYKKINGPLPVEWENEVFEKYEKPYKREGAGLALAELYLKADNFSKDSLISLLNISATALNTFRADSITLQLDTPGHFFLCNRLFLLNLAAIYTTGFECPENKNVIPELRSMVTDVKSIYSAFNQSFPATPLTVDYLELYEKTIDFVNHQSGDFEQFDHYGFIKNFVNPLFAINQQLIVKYGAFTGNTNDYTLNNNCGSIFDKSLYTPQNTKGIYALVQDEAALKEIREVGKLLFYDPVLSGNNQRSCVSCHKSKEYFTDTSFATSLGYDRERRLPRNTPTLVDVIYNHLLMLDGREISLQTQAKDVMTNPVEMGGNEKEILEKVLSCREYKMAFKKFLKLTPEENEITIAHIASAITYYYGDFSKYYAPFDEAMNDNKPVDPLAIRGFNLFMGKAQCGTCHYVPEFNGVPPPYIGSEFEVIGVPGDTAYNRLSDDSGRYKINPAFETLRAFRTGSLRNARFTGPYMHNGVFSNLDQVIDFYDAGGAAGRKMNIINQSLSADSLKLTMVEKKELLSFLYSLNESVIFEKPPEKLPVSSMKELNSRKVGGEY